MTYIKRKKNSRMRGSMTHGWGAKKKHRGAGNRGGRGMAGTGKRADAKKPSILKTKNYFGKHGFTSIKQKKKNIDSTITIKIIDESVDKWLKEGKIKKEKDFYVVDLSELGYDKLLGSGKPRFKYKITVKSASSKAVEKLSGAGSELKLLSEVSEGSSKSTKEQDNAESQASVAD